jgi:F0F1-type ATP synthase membrane subunit c/vacuolar-type H+-ATPase subunit K
MAGGEIGPTLCAKARHESARPDGRELVMRRTLEIGGVVAAAILIAFGVVALILGVNGRSTVRNGIKQEKIVGAADMTPVAIAAEAKAAKLPASVALPTCSVAGKDVTNGSRARCFAQYMRIHTLEATGGYTYAQMGRYQAKPDTPKTELAVGGGTDNTTYAAVDPTTKQPVANGARNIWVTETALTTALNTSYMADQLSLFSVVVGIALLLAGIGFGVLALGGALRNQEAAFKLFGKGFPKSGGAHAPTA